jgi:hypothetical protein
MSEYQRYEFMTCDRPLTRAQLDAVNDLSSHIEASSTHALIEYHWGNFKHDPIKVLHEFFDGFLYWANWGSPKLAFRFPHGVLNADLFDVYDFEDFVTFTRYEDYDILDIHFGEMEGPDQWIEYELGSLIPIRDELMEGDLRALYIVWLASQVMMYGYEEDQEEEDYEIFVPPVPPNFGKLTEAQQALVQLLQVPDELLLAASRHGTGIMSPAQKDDFAAWVKLLPADHKNEYLLRLAQNEPGLRHQFVRELRELNRDKERVRPPTGEQVTYATLNSESKAIKSQREREKRERERAQHLRRLQYIHDHQEEYWLQINQAVEHTVGARYDDAVRNLVELREAADQFNETQEFQERFRTWVQAYSRRPGLIHRLQQHKFSIP